MVEDKDSFTIFEGLYWQVSRSMGFVWKKIFERQFPGSQSSLLFLLEKGGAQRMAHLADALNITPGAVTSLSEKLIVGGFIRRTRDDQDRRVSYLEITSKGKETMKDLREEGRRMMKSAFEGIPESDIQHLARIFEQVAVNTEKIRGGEGEWNISQKNEK